VNRVIQVNQLVVNAEEIDKQLIVYAKSVSLMMEFLKTAFSASSNAKFVAQTVILVKYV
jgi:hypothetical protein